ncbi:MAG: hypothetical protein M0Q54_04555, partial [Pigmentiphaga sp.]|nr:hypothetical protein [Pigmentiphaga sp.]
WSAIQSDEIHLLPGVYELNIHYTGSGIDVDKFTITNQHIPLVHDGEISGDQMKISFEDMHDVNAMISSNVQDAAYISDLNFINADNQGLNTSNRCAYFKGNSKKPLWWHGFDFTFTEPIEAPNNSYLHVLLKKSMAESQRVQITLVNLSGQQSDPLFNDPISTEWVDYVMPIPEMHKTFNRLYVKFNAQSPDTECFADEFLLTDDPAPRTALASRLDAMVTPRGMITVSNRDIRIDTNETSHIKLFNASGRQLGATHASTLHYTVSQPGLYIVHADGKSEKVLVYK